MVHKTKMISENLGDPLLSGVGVQLFPVGGGGWGGPIAYSYANLKKCSENYLDPLLKVNWIETIGFL